MGCFLGCFGFSCKRKRRKPAYRIQPRDQGIESYQPLDSCVSINLDITRNPIISDSEISNKRKERWNNKIRKKVSFNLNVQTYEPICSDETLSDFGETDEGGRKEENGEEIATGSSSISLSKGYLFESKTESFPSNYRYRSCIDTYYEEDDIAYIDSNYLDTSEYEDEDDDDWYTDASDKELSQEELSGKEENNFKPVCASSETELSTCGVDARERSEYVHSVLAPVENLTQWKAIKARAAPTKHQKKQNVAVEQAPIERLTFMSHSNLQASSLDSESNYHPLKPLLQEINVAASLSNWITAPQ